MGKPFETGLFWGIPVILKPVYGRNMLINNCLFRWYLFFYVTVECAICVWYVLVQFITRPSMVFWFKGT